MNTNLNLLIGLAMGLNLIALGSSRLPSLIRAVSLQGMVLGVMPLLLEHDAGWLLIGVVESLGGLYLGESLGQIGIFAIFIAVLLFRPQGLFGAKA